MDIQVISKDPVTGLDRRVKIIKIEMNLDMIGIKMKVEALKEGKVVNTRTLSPYSAELTTIGQFVNKIDGSDAVVTENQKCGIDALPEGVVSEVDFMKELTTNLTPELYKEKRIFWLNWAVAKIRILKLDGEKYFDE